MKKLLFYFLLVYSPIAFSQTNKTVFDKVITVLSSINGIGYHYSLLTTQGMPTDTMLIQTEGQFAFQVNSSDSLLGCNFWNSSEVLHPYFKKIVKNQSFYDGSNYYQSSIAKSIFRNMKTEKIKLKKEQLIDNLSNQASEILSLLKSNNQIVLNKKDTLFERENCYKYLLKDSLSGLLRVLVISKKNNYPLYLKSIINPKQPFIEECFFSNYIQFSRFDSNKYIQEFSNLKDTINEKIEVLKNDEEIPNWIMEDLSGKKISMSELKGKVIFINLTSVFCGPCYKKIPYLNNLYKKYKTNSDVVFISFFYLPAETQERLIKYKERNKVDYPIFFKPQNSIMNKIDLAYPSFILVDKNNKLKVVTESLNNNNFESFFEKEIDLRLKQK